MELRNALQVASDQREQSFPPEESKEDHVENVATRSSLGALDIFLQQRLEEDAQERSANRRVRQLSAHLSQRHDDGDGTAADVFREDRLVDVKLSQKNDQRFEDGKRKSRWSLTIEGNQGERLHAVHSGHLEKRQQGCEHVDEERLAAQRRVILR